MDPSEPADPSLFVLPVLTGHVDNFDAIPAKVRELLRYRSTPVGPWLYDPREQRQSVWEWVARSGYGDSCRDARILDEFVEIVFAYHPETRTLGAALWRPSSRSVLTKDLVLANQVMSYVAAHLEEPLLMAAVRTPRLRRREPETAWLGSPLVPAGAGVALGLEELSRVAYARALRPPKDNPVVQIVVDAAARVPGVPPMPPAPSPSLFVADWLDVLLKDPWDDAAVEYSVPQTEDELFERLADVHSEVFGLDPEEDDEDWPYVMTVDALLARVVERTNELRRLYRHHAAVWPELPRLRSLNPTAHVTFCLSTPELARLGADIPCQQCEGCGMASDLTLVDQLRLDLAS